MEYHTPVHGTEKESSTLLKVDVGFLLSDGMLTSSHLQLAMKLGKNFAKRNNVDEELYQAEAAFHVVMIHRGMYGEIADEVEMKRKVYKEMWKYYYADRVVAARSTSTIWEGNLPTATEDAAMVMLGDQTINLLDLVDEVAHETREKEYLLLVIQGKTKEEIQKTLDISTRLLADIRSRIVKRIRECKHSSPSGITTRRELASTGGD